MTRESYLKLREDTIPDHPLDFLFAIYMDREGNLKRDDFIKKIHIATMGQIGGFANKIVIEEDKKHNIIMVIKDNKILKVW